MSYSPNMTAARKRRPGKYSKRVPRAATALSLCRQVHCHRCLVRRGFSHDEFALYLEEASKVCRLESELRLNLGRKLLERRYNSL